MYQPRSSSPINFEKINDNSLNENDFFDFSQPDLSTNSSRKCSDSDCSICEPMNVNDSKTNKMKNEKSLKRCRSHSHNSLFNKSSSSSSSDSKNNSLLRQINNSVIEEESINISDIKPVSEDCKKLNRPFLLENINNSFENDDDTFWNLYRIAFNSFVKEDEPKDDFEYFKLAEKCALSNFSKQPNKHYGA